MPEETTPDLESLQAAGRVWSHLSAIECVGILWIALRYDARESSNGIYIERMSLLPWLSLGEPLQHDICRALQQLRRRLTA